jgi:hypothetical protein
MRRFRPFGRRPFRAGWYGEACTLAERALALEPDLAALHFLLGSARIELRDFPAGDAAFGVCFALRPKCPMVLYAQARGAVARARVRLAQGKSPAAVGRDPAGRRRVSLVICSIRPEKFEAACANDRALLAGVPYEIIGIHDARSLCEGYNRGIRRSTGEIVILSHDDLVIVNPDFAALLRASFESRPGRRCRDDPLDRRQLGRRRLAAPARAGRLADPPAREARGYRVPGPRRDGSRGGRRSTARSSRCGARRSSACSSTSGGSTAGTSTTWISCSPLASRA